MLSPNFSSFGSAISGSAPNVTPVGVSSTTTNLPSQTLQSVQNNPSFAVGTSPPGGMFDPYAFAQDYDRRASESAQEQREWEEAMAQKQMDFQKMMSDTSYQRAKADLEAAGLNPYMALMSASGAGFGGASTPSGGMATSSHRPVYSENDTLLRDLTVFTAVLQSVTSIFNGLMNAIPF